MENGILKLIFNEAKEAAMHRPFFRSVVFFNGMDGVPDQLCLITMV